MANLSPHFTLAEMIRSEACAKRGIANIPDDAEIMNGVLLCSEILEPFRELIGMPMKVNSGFRGHECNALVGGMFNSAHLYFRACDFIVPNLDLSEAWAKVKDSGLPWDQLIWETNKTGSQWIHVAIAKQGETPRKEVLYLQQRPLRRFVS